MSRRPYHVTLTWPDGIGPRDPTVVSLEREEALEHLAALVELEARERKYAGAIYDPRVRYASGLCTGEDDCAGDEWRDLDASSLWCGQRDCIDVDVVRDVLRSDVAAARKILLRHVMSDDSGVSDDCVVAHLTYCVTHARRDDQLLLDFHALSLRQLPVLMARIGGVR